MSRQKKSIYEGIRPPTTSTQNQCLSPGPGPGAYLLPTTVGYIDHDQTKWRGPAYTMAHRVPWKVLGADIPAPIYNVRGTRYGNPCYKGVSIKGRFYQRETFTVPAPGAYSPEKFKDPKGKSPAYSIVGRPRPRTRSTCPGPQYTIPSTIGRRVPDLKASPACTIATRVSTKVDYRSPGPAAYDPPNLDAVKYIFPAACIGGRYNVRSLAVSPGPLAYNPTFRTGPSPPKFSFGMKTPACIKPFVTPLDDV